MVRADFLAHDYDDVATSFFMLCDPLQFDDAMSAEYCIILQHSY